MTDQVPERSDVPSTGDLGDNVVCIVADREATNEELGNYRIVVRIDGAEGIEIVKDNTGGARIVP